MHSPYYTEMTPITDYCAEWRPEKKGDYGAPEIKPTPKTPSGNKEKIPV